MGAKTKHESREAATSVESTHHHITAGQRSEAGVIERRVAAIFDGRSAVETTLRHAYPFAVDRAESDTKRARDATKLATIQACKQTFIELGLLWLFAT